MPNILQKRYIWNLD